MSRDGLPTGAGRRPAEITAPARCSNLRIDPRGYPIIGVIPQAPGKEDFGGLSEKRKLVLATYDLCAVCAMPFRDELRWQVTFNDQLHHMGPAPTFNEAPVHKICALYAAQVCPFVSSPHARLGDAQRKGQRRPETLVLAGFTGTAAVFGHESDLQAGENILMFEMDELRSTHQLTSASDARDAYEAALGDEASIELDDQERRIIEILCAPTLEENEDSGGVMAGAAWFIGAAFCPQIKRVQAMKQFAESRDDFYFQMAANFLFYPNRMADWEDAEDASTAAAVSWFRSRDSLPEVLRPWRSDAARRLRDSKGRRPIPTTKRAPVVRDEDALRRRREAEARLRRRRRKK
ncbi:hypothetical protein [Glycomyces xiaoerkulensis]|uniref:hypothetical protein n=1 Tax=Glycomyces xiaoerkulensis TaxID=2038139 RepID=UPI0012FFE222|nr:hypothetical protein [Glycomyces xiaoerkulensis]